MSKTAYKHYSREDQKALASWAAACAQRVLPLFEEFNPEDARPREAIERCRAWVRTGVFKMVEIRGASLGAHAAARGVKDNEAAVCAARAAGQAVATAHVPQHAYGAAYYALRAVQAANPADAERRVTKERDWQSRHLPVKLRQEVMSRIVVVQKRGGVQIKIQKGEGF